MISKNHQEVSVATLYAIDTRLYTQLIRDFIRNWYATLYAIEIKINLMRTNIKRDNEQKQCMLSLEQLHPNNTRHSACFPWNNYIPTIHVTVHAFLGTITSQQYTSQCMLSLEQLHPNNTHHTLLMSKDITA